MMVHIPQKRYFPYRHTARVDQYFYSEYASASLHEAVAFHLNKYLINYILNESLQSAYTSGHSTETALVRVKNDIMMSIDQGKPVIVVLLDLSAAFDTVEHNVPFSRLKEMFGLSGRVLEWF